MAAEYEGFIEDVVGKLQDVGEAGTITYRAAINACEKLGNGFWGLGLREEEERPWEKLQASMVSIG